MKNELTAYEIQILDFRIDQWIERNGLLSGEIKAYKALVEMTADHEEIDRRRVFLKELMRDF